MWRRYVQPRKNSFCAATRAGVRVLLYYICVGVAGEILVLPQLVEGIPEHIV